MNAVIIGKALVVAWSFTLSNLGPTPQVVDLGPAPTDSAYVPVTAVIRNCDGTGFDSDKDKLVITFGTSPKEPARRNQQMSYQQCGGGWVRRVITMT